jgi:hypothetical protein
MARILGTIAKLFPSGVDVIIGQALGGAVGPFLPWKRWRGASREESE